MRLDTQYCVYLMRINGSNVIVENKNYNQKIAKYTRIEARVTSNICEEEPRKTRVPLSEGY